MRITPTAHHYAITTDVFDRNDDGELKVSLASTSFSSDKFLTPLEAVKHAENLSDWKIYSLGEGDEERLDSYHIEYYSPEDSDEDWCIVNYIPYGDSDVDVGKFIGWI